MASLPHFRLLRSALLAVALTLPGLSPAQDPPPDETEPPPPSPAQQAYDDATQFGNQARQQAPKPEMDQATGRAVVTLPDGSTEDATVFSNENGDPLSQQDLDQMQSYYNKPKTSEEKADQFETPEGRFIRSTFQNSSHRSMQNDPAITASERGVAAAQTPGFAQAVYGECAELEVHGPGATPSGGSQQGTETYEPAPDSGSSSNVADQSGDAPENEGESGSHSAPTGATQHECFTADVPTIDSCEVTHQVRFGTGSEVRTTVAILVDASAPVSALSFEHASRAAQTLAAVLSRTSHARYGVWTYGGAAGDPAFAIKGLNEPMRPSEVGDRIRARGRDGAPNLASAMDQVAHLLSNARGGRQILINISNAAPGSDNACQHAANCTPGGVRAHYGSDVLFAALGINTGRFSSWPHHAKANGRAQIGAALYQLVTRDTGWIETDDRWAPTPCLKAALGNSASGNTNPAGNATVTCSARPTFNCNTFDGLELCSNDWGQDLSNEGLPVSQLCGAADVRGARYCFTANDGAQHCISETGISNGGENCDAYRNDPYCGQQSSVCSESTRDPQTGNCYVYEDVFQCTPNSGQVTFSTHESNNPECEPVSCEGGACGVDTSYEEESNDDFQDAAVMTSVIDQTMSDFTECDVENISECRFFVGEPMWCNDYRNFIPTNCCSRDTIGMSLGQYLQGAKAVKDGYDALRSMDVNFGFGTGSWPDIPGVSDGSAYVWDLVKKPLGTAYESLASGFAGLKAQATSAYKHAAELFNLEEIKEEALAQVKRFTEKYFPDFAQSMFAEQGGQAAAGVAAQELAGELVGYANFVMAVYGYYQMAVAVYDMYSDCNGKFKGTNQMMLRSKRDDLKACHHVATHTDRSSFAKMKRFEFRGYCCYSGPFARIMQQQVRHASTIPSGWGNAHEPNCEGLTIDQIQSVDWSKMDLSEWKQIVFEQGLQPGDDEYDAASDFQRKTRNDEDEDVWVPPDSEDRTNARTEEMDMDAAARDMNTEAYKYKDEAGYPTEAPY